jgi:hypothetical protein
VKVQTDTTTTTRGGKVQKFGSTAVTSTLWILGGLLAAFIIAAAIAWYVWKRT